MSIQSWYFCVQDEEELWFWMCLIQVSMLYHFCLFFKLCSWDRKLAYFVCLFHHPSSHFTKLLARALFFGPCHCSYIFVPCLAFRVHVTGDLGLLISSELSPKSLQIVWNFAGWKLSAVYINQTNLNVKFSKKLGEARRGQPKIWEGPWPT